MPYSFSENKYPGVPILELHEVEADKKFMVEDVEIQPVNIMHYRLPIMGYRIGDFAYLTDVKFIPEEEYQKLQGLDTLVITALREQEHIAHMSLQESLKTIERIAPKKSYLTHMSHQIGLHRKVQESLPENVFLSYDGLEIEV